MSREYSGVLPTTREKYVGKVFPSNNFGDFIILECNAANDAKIKFLETDFIDTVFITQVRSGSVRDYMKPLILGKGIIGAKLTTEEYKHKAYKNWVRILKRCYDENQRHKHPTYSGCTVSEFFLTYTNFRAWYVKQKNWDNPDFVLDKDLLCGKGGKIYSEDTCVFIPKEINSLLTTTKASRGLHPIGVSYSKNSKRYETRICRNNKEVFIGSFETPQEAFYTYKHLRESYLKEKALQWKDLIDSRAYDALMRWEINIDD